MSEAVVCGRGPAVGKYARMNGWLLGRSKEGGGKEASYMVGRGW